MEEMKFKISKSTKEVYSKSGGMSVVKFETLNVTTDEISSIVRRYNYSMSMKPPTCSGGNDKKCPPPTLTDKIIVNNL